MSIQQISEIETFNSPCGCPGCEKWADCEFCYNCTPSKDPDWVARYEAETAYREEMAKPFGEWLFG